MTFPSFSFCFNLVHMANLRKLVSCRRQGEGLRIYWGSLEQQSLLSRWNPWSTEVPYATFTEHPMKYTSEKFLEICKVGSLSLIRLALMVKLSASKMCTTQKKKEKIQPGFIQIQILKGL